MPSGKKNMDNMSDDQLLIIQVTIDAYRQDYDEKMKKFIEYLTEMFVSMMDQMIFLIITRQ